MKSIVAGLVFIIGCTAASQSLRPPMPDLTNEPEPIELNQVTVAAFNPDLHSATGDGTTDSLPDALKSMPIATSIRAIGSSTSRGGELKSFRSHRFNRMLIATEFFARGLDALSTHNKLNDPCGCYREASHFFGLNMSPVF